MIEFHRDCDGGWEEIIVDGVVVYSGHRASAQDWIGVLERVCHPVLAPVGRFDETGRWVPES